MELIDRWKSFSSAEPHREEKPGELVDYGAAGLGAQFMRLRVHKLLAMLAVWVLVGTAEAAEIEWIPIGDPGNACHQIPSVVLCSGSVGDTYQISKFEVTNSQYAEFLNAVAASDPRDLYDDRMSSSSHGGVTRSGSSGSFVYVAKAGFANKPVVFVSFYDASRFANWLHNGKPSGPQDSSTTEDGAYTITPAGISNDSIARNPDAEVFLPTYNEWYKAAYYDETTRSYFDFPTGTDVETVCEVPPGGANSANCSGVGTVTDVGAYPLSVSPSGTFDQGGNVWEYTETKPGGGYFAFRVSGGGSWTSPRNLEVSLSRGVTQVDPPLSDRDAGFRVASVVESVSIDASEYFPLQSGNEWTYLLNGSAAVTEIILDGTVVVNGVVTKALQDSDGFVSYYSNDSNGVRLHRQFESGVDFGDGIPRDFTATYSPPLQFLRALTDINDEVSGNGNVTADIAGRGSFTLSYTFTSKIEILESVSVPLGTFLVLKVKTTVNLTGSISGASINDTEIDTLWLAKYVGPVKVTQELVGEGIDTLELDSVFIDSDSDGVNVTDDNCPINSNPGQTDTDSDGLGNLCDSDDDNDGLDDAQELGIGTDPLDSDSDDDGTNDGADPFPNDPAEDTDTDRDGTGNNADSDDDNDGMPDDFENKFGLNPLDATDAGLDNDRDGLSNLEEFERGRNPKVNEPLILLLLGGSYEEE